MHQIRPACRNSLSSVHLSVRKSCVIATENAEGFLKDNHISARQKESRMEKKKRALITGLTGQDGAYLAKLLLEKGYEVYGTHRRTSTDNSWRIRELGIYAAPHFHLVECDLTDLGCCIRTLEKTEPDEVYNLAAQSFVAVSFAQPEMTAQITALGALRMLEAIRTVNPRIRFYQASTSELFGKVQEVPQTENTPFYPRSPYGVAKLYAHWITMNYRESYDMFACSGILFNHESPLRGIEFVTRKITDAFAKISLGQQEYVELGNLDAKRDWGYAPEYVEGMWRMLQTPTPDNFVLATGETKSIRDFVELTAKAVGVDLEWRGKGVDEVGIERGTSNVRVRVNPSFYRPTEVDMLVGDAEKAYRILGWKAKTFLPEICRMMLEADMRRNTLMQKERRFS